MPSHQRTYAFAGSSRSLHSRSMLCSSVPGAVELVSPDERVHGHEVDLEPPSRVAGRRRKLNGLLDQRQPARRARPETAEGEHGERPARRSRRRPLRPARAPQRRVDRRGLALREPSKAAEPLVDLHEQRRLPGRRLERLPSQLDRALQAAAFLDIAEKDERLGTAACPRPGMKLQRERTSTASIARVEVGAGRCNRRRSRSSAPPTA